MIDFAVMETYRKDYLWYVWNRDTLEVIVAGLVKAHDEAIRLGKLHRCKLREKARHCAFCGAPSQGNYRIHRDGFAAGPEVLLCDDHGSGKEPSCADIWAAIAQPSSGKFAYHVKGFE